MKYAEARMAKLLIDFFGDDFRRIKHALDVLHYAKNICETRKDCDEEILIAAALLHDVGIKPSEERYGWNNGKTQEELGPPIAEMLLSSIGFPEEKIKIVSDIIGNHHSRSRFDYPELAVLKEADAIVNRKEKACEIS